jgi:ribonucleoside-diphosphate reductase alpha chain
LSTTHYDYGTLAARISITNHQKNTDHAFSNVMRLLFDNRDQNNSHYPLVAHDVWNFVLRNETKLNSMIVHSRDFLLDYFGFKTLQKTYLFRTRLAGIVEQIQHMWLRVAVGIHFTSSKETYDLMSQKYFTHATPTLFHAGTPRPQMSSCYLLAMEEDSLNGIYNTLHDCAMISKWSGGIGLHVHTIRAKGTLIQGTHGASTGLVPMLRVFNNTARYVDQGGKRNGSFAIYLEPWHADIEDFLLLKKNHGDEDRRARDLFYGLWVPDLFMQRVKDNALWSLMCPHLCPGLADVVGDDFVALYTRYERDPLFPKRVIQARELWFKILDSQMETGTPYMLYKDACNRRSNQKNIGVIQSSNLCTEIIEYSDNNETAVCNLASVALPSFVHRDTHSFDFKKLFEVTKVVTTNLNNIIDLNFYPTQKTRNSNLRHRPIGIGVQGLADCFVLMDIPFHSEQALDINRRIFETMYFAALERSHELAVERGGPYASFENSPLSLGFFQFDLAGAPPRTLSPINDELILDWSALRKRIMDKGGVLNSLLMAPMPTASTSQILGFNECFEPFTSNLYTRGTMAGEFVMVNKYLMKDLIDLGLWNDDIKNNIIANKGSVQHLDFLSDSIKHKYKTVWEIPMKHVIDMAVDRGLFICQSQSMNIWMEDPNYTKLTNMHMYGWSKGLKTGMYYLRRKGRHQAQQFTIPPVPRGANDEDEDQDQDQDQECLACSA